jgi:argininosuccinate lyase
MLRSRMKKEMDRLALKFSSSIGHDRNIFYYDILVDIAHTLTLLKSGYLDKNEAKEILQALKEIRDSGFKNWNYEDVHEAIEAEVTKKTKAGLKMHTGRSRNDEVATCLRMFARDRLLAIADSLLRLEDVILGIAEENHGITPGFTHLQYAQPTRLSHHLTAYFDMLARELERIMDAFHRTNKCPLGSAAFASTGYILDRSYSAELLGFDGIAENSEDAVASRDFLIESIFICTSIMLSLSRIAEEIILWSSEFDFIELPEEYSSTSSIMPQKKNPDIAELIRANSGKLIGNLTSALAIYKAMPFSYNRDFQEMNELLYDSMERTELAIEVTAGMLSKIKFRDDVMREKASKGFATATELADVLVRNYGIPFRIAHKIVGHLALEEKFKPTAEDVEDAAKKFGYEIVVDDESLSLTVEEIVEGRKNAGGTAIEEVRRMLEKRKEKMREWQEKVEKMFEKIAASLEKLYDEAEKLGVDFHGGGKEGED